MKMEDVGKVVGISIEGVSRFKGGMKRPGRGEAFCRYLCYWWCGWGLLSWGEERSWAGGRKRGYIYHKDKENDGLCMWKTCEEFVGWKMVM